MNDRHKYRVWDKYLNVMITDVRGWVIDQKKERFRYFRDNNDMPDGMGTELMLLENAIIEQCTGLKDKNGKLIFEGDVVEWEHKAEEYDIVWFLWSEERMGWWCNDIFKNEFNICELNYNCCEIIGNIHEKMEPQDETN